MRKSMSKRLIATVVLITIIAGNSTVAVYANEVKKDESVYVTLKSDGTENEKIVSDWIHSSDSNATVTDKSSLEEIKNVKGEEKPVQDGENITWTLKDNDLYYQGKSTKQLPISVSIKYYLDGAEISKEDIAGKSGKVKISLKFTNNNYEEKQIGDKMRKIYTPLSVAGGMALPTDTFKNIKINEGKVISEGNTNVASFAVLPGMKETLDIDGVSSKLNVNLTDTIEVEADATNFSLGPIMMAASTMMPELNTVDAADDIDKLNDSLKMLKDSSDKLLDGTNKLKSGTDSAAGKLADAKKILRNPRVQEKLSLVTKDNNVLRANRLIEDAFVAQGMDTSAVKQLLGLISSGNFEKADALLADVRDLSQYKSTLDSSVTAINALTGDKKVQKLMGDVTVAKKTYDGIDNSTKQKLKGLSGVMTKENLQKGQQLVRGAKNAETQLDLLMKKGNTLKGQVDQLTVQIVNATGSSSVEEAMTKIDTQLAAVNQFYSDKGQAQLQSMLKDVTNYSEGFLVMKAYIANDIKQTIQEKKVDFNTAFTVAQKKAIAIIHGVYGDSGTKLVQMVQALKSTQFTSDGILKDAQDIKTNGTYMTTMISTVNGMKPLIQVVAQAKPILTEAKKILEGDEVKGLTQFYGAVSNIQNKAFIDSLANAYLSLNENDINSIVSLKNSVATLSADVEANKENIASIEKMAAGLKGKDMEITAKVNKLEKDMAQAKTLLNSVEALVKKTDKNSIDKASSMAKTLLSMQNDLKNSDDILRITQDALSKGNVSQARSLVNSLPKLEDGVKQLCDGITQLNDGMKQFSDEGINKINDKGTTAITDVKNVLKVKDEMVKMSKKYDNFTGKDDSMISTVKFVLKTEEIKAPLSKENKVKTTTQKKTGFIEWIKNLFK